MESIPKAKTPVLVVDDDEGLLLSIKATMLSAGLSEPALVSDSRRVPELVKMYGFQLILLDLIMPHMGGLELLQQVHKKYPEIECVVVTAVDEAASAVQAMSYGAYDYLVKPLNSEKLVIVINHALERYNLKRELSFFEKKQSFTDLINPEAFADILTEDDSMALVFRQVEAVAPTDYSVVIYGESGTGKEMLARVVHSLSNRSGAPFLAVNMASFNKTIFEDAFFGHTKGAYTNASSDKRGFFEAAHSGTLFLDEITELDPMLQGKLLRVIEERELYRLGSTEVRNVDVRIIAATNRDINHEIERTRLRADLFYRLNQYHIKIPPLRKRKKDILPLARHFTKIHAKANHKKIGSLASDLAQSLLAYPFPGNVRELENMIAGAVLLESGPVLSRDSVSQFRPPAISTAQPEGALPTLAEVEKQHTLKVLKATGGNRKMAARILGINSTTVYRKIEKLNLKDQT